MLIRIAAHNSSSADRSNADYACDGTDDETTIADALAALGPAPGTLLFHDGEYGPGGLTNQAGAGDPPGCIQIRRGDIVLKSDGLAQFRLGDDENCNLFRSAGNGFANIYFGEGFVLDGNRANNLISNNFECCGVRINSTGAIPYKNVWIRGLQAAQARGLNVMVGGTGVHVRESAFGDASSDVVELAPGSSGDIIGCEAEITGQTGFVFGSDAMSDVQIVNNRTIVRAGGSVTEAVHRTWQGQNRNAITGNHIAYEVGASIHRAIHARGYHNLIAGNTINGLGGDYGRPKIVVNGLTELVGNYLTYCDVYVEDTSGGYKVSYAGHSVGSRFPGAGAVLQGSVQYPAIPAYAGFVRGWGVEDN